MILVLDTGTSSARGLLVDDEGESVWQFGVRYSPSYIDRRTVLQDPLLIRKAIFRILEKVGEWLIDQGQFLEAITVTSQRSSVIPISAGGLSLMEALSWQDTRADEICCELEENKSKIFQVTGVHLSSVFSAPKIGYLKRHYWQMYDDAEKIIGFHEYVLFLLTRRFVTDQSIASRTGLFDVSKRCWSDELLSLFEIDKEKLCEVVPAGTIIGKTISQVNVLLQTKAAIPVISAGGDQQCALLGMGCIQQGDIEINLGTGGFVLGVTQTPVLDQRYGLNCNISAVADQWILEGSIPSAGKAIDWVVQHFYGDEVNEKTLESFEKESEKSPIGAAGVKVYPIFGGVATEKRADDSGASIMNLHLSHTRGDIARATLEGVVREIKCYFQKMTFLVGKPKCIRVSGGLTKNRLLCRIMADMLNVTVKKSMRCEATGIGAWLSAMVALRKGESHMAIYERCFREQPMEYWEPNPEAVYLYHQLNKAKADEADLKLWEK